MSHPTPVLPILRIHPSIGFARVGDSDEYLLAPETIAGLPIPGQATTGGLPIRPGTERETITSGDLRDQAGALKRQAARFRIYAYPSDGQEAWPTGQGEEIKIGSTFGERTVKDIVWQVHLANKKANTYVLEDPENPNGAIIDNYAHGKTPPLRNPAEGSDPANAARIRRLTIDAGPRVVRGRSARRVAFDKATPPSYVDAKGAIHRLDNYPKSFPDDSFNRLYTPSGAIDTLGDMETDAEGRLIVIGGRGRAIAWTRADGTPYPLDEDVDNDGWFDDTADGPVSARLVFDDGSQLEAVGAWVISTDPAYAPQTLNVVSLWDDIYDTFVRKLQLRPDIYDRRFQDDYVAGFSDDIQPIFIAAALQQWNTNLPAGAQRAHEVVGRISAGDDPDRTIMAGLAFIRDPNKDRESEVGVPLMPLSLGDSGKAFLSVSKTQWFFLTQWDGGRFDKGPSRPLGPGEGLDRASLQNCLGGRFSPGIDMTFISRQPDLWVDDWQGRSGPFRIGAKRLDYAAAQASQPLLGAGYVPLHSPPGQVEPGDVSKFMALPWHTDYNSCATHPTSPNPTNASTLYWSWPAQRPVAVYVAADVVDGKLGAQRYSVRGEGTASKNPANQGRYQERIEMIKRWPRIGVVVQGTVIEGGDYQASWYLEVQSLLDAPEVEPWPINALGEDGE